MPYKDPDKQREAKARLYRERYQSDPEFRAKEAERKAEWVEDNDQRKAVMRRYSRRWRKEQGGS